MRGNSRLSNLAQLVDRHLEDRVLVFGSLPPDGRDLDLLARPAERAVLVSLLTRTGLARRGDCWADFGVETAAAVDIVAASSWSLPADELDELFVAARPLEGLSQLVRPAPEHALLIAARRFVRSREQTRAKLMRYVEAALAEDATAWSAAESHAAGWRAERSLCLLRATRGGASPSLRAIAAALLDDTKEQPAMMRVRTLAGLAPHPRRTLVVSFSGLDGAGKSSHAHALRRSMEQLGVPTIVVWSPLGGNVTLDLIAVPAKRLLAATRRGRLSGTDARGGSGSVMSDPDRTFERGRAASAVTTAWATLVLALNALSQRRALLRQAGRARVVVFDRYALDSFVRLRFLYGRSGRSKLQRWLARSLAPKADAAFLLEIRAETAWARKSDDWTLEQLRRQADLYREERDSFPVERVDAEAGAEQVAAKIASTVWRRLPRE